MKEKKVIIVLGATGGIGSAIVTQLKSEQFRLGLLSLSITPFETDSILARPVDISDLVAVSSFVKNVFSKFGRIDAVVNVIGCPADGAIENLALDDIKIALDIHVMYYFNFIKEVLPIMLRQGCGTFILINSLRALFPAKNKAAYCLSKAAASSLSKVLLKEKFDEGISSTVINPGFTDTAFHKYHVRRPYQWVNGVQIPVLITKPEDIAKAVSFILSLSKGAVIEELNIGRAFIEMDEAVEYKNVCG